MEKKEINYDNVGKRIGKGLTSDVFMYTDDKGYEVALKFFKRKIKVYNCGIPKIIDFDEKMQKNKEEKLKLLDKDICMMDDPKPFDLLYDENLGLVGYTMEYSDLPTLEDYRWDSKRKKLILLKKLRERVEELNRNGIYIGDFYSDDNFLVDDNGEIKFLDIDNFNVHGLDFDLSNPYMDNYFERNKKINNVDNYMFNLYTLSFYSRVIMPRLLLSLQENGMPHRFDTKENHELINDMLTKKNYEKRYILDSQKKGLF